MPFALLSLHLFGDDLSFLSNWDAKTKEVPSFCQSRSVYSDYKAAWQGAGALRSLTGFRHKMALLKLPL